MTPHQQITLALSEFEYPKTTIFQKHQILTKNNKPH